MRRVAWIERTLPGDGDALGDYLLEAKRPDASLEDPPEELVSYLQLIGRAGDVAEEHELLFALQIDAQRPAAQRAITRMGGGDLGALAVLAGEVGQLIELLDEAAITVTGVLTRRGLAAAIRDGYDPWGRRAAPTPTRTQPSLRTRGSRRTPPAPTARDEHWSHLAADGALALHAVGVGVAADRRARAVPAAAADGHADHADDRDVHGARRPGQRDPPRRARRDRDRDRAEPARPGRAAHQPAPVAARPARPASASASSPKDTPPSATPPTSPSASPDTGPTRSTSSRADVSRVELEAKRAPLRLERMWGQQAEAFTYGLPLCRGLR